MSFVELHAIFIHSIENFLLTLPKAYKTDIMNFYRYISPALGIFSSLLFLCACDSSEFNDDDLDFPSPIAPHRAKISAVDYSPAPGQFVNEMPTYEDGDTRASMNAKALEVLNRGGLISLGAFGGEITITLAEPIFHNPGEDADFRVLGNSYITGAGNGVSYGSSEPGMVWIMKDENGNGKPDDTWYRFVGDMQDEIAYMTVTYTPNPNPTSAEWVDWVSDSGDSGHLTCNTAYHDHTYFPLWLNNGTSNVSMTKAGYAVPANGFLDTSTGLYRQICYPGFADSFPNNDIRSAFSIKDAVDILGNHADIDRVDFIRITTAVLDSNGPLGETSTEIGGIEILH